MTPALRQQARSATCHPDRPHIARGLCRKCYQARWRKPKLDRLRRQRERNCEVCGRLYTPDNTRGRLCSLPCRHHFWAHRQSVREGCVMDQYRTTHDGEIAAQFVLMLKARGFRRVPPKKASRIARRGGPYFSAWKRSHAEGALYVVRWWCRNWKSWELAA